MSVLDDPDGGEKPDEGNDNSRTNDRSDSSDSDGDKSTAQDRSDDSQIDKGQSLSRVEMGDSFRENAVPRSFGFPELSTFGDRGGSNPDSDLGSRKELAEGAWMIVTGKEPDLSSVSPLPSLKEVTIGIAAGASAFLLGPEIVGGEIVLDSSEAILGTNPLAGVADAIQSISNSVGTGLIASKATELYERTKTRLAGYFKFNATAGAILQWHSVDDHTPGESRRQQRDIKP